MANYGEFLWDGGKPNDFDVVMQSLLDKQVMIDRLPLGHCYDLQLSIDGTTGMMTVNITARMNSTEYVELKDVAYMLAQMQDTPSPH